MEALKNGERDISFYFLTHYKKHEKCFLSYYGHAIEMISLLTFYINMINHTRAMSRQLEFGQHQCFSFRKFAPL